MNQSTAAACIAGGAACGVALKCCLRVCRRSSAAAAAQPAAEKPACGLGLASVAQSRRNRWLEGAPSPDVDVVDYVAHVSQLERMLDLVEVSHNPFPFDWRRPAVLRELEVLMVRHCAEHRPGDHEAPVPRVRHSRIRGPLALLYCLKQRDSDWGFPGLSYLLFEWGCEAAAAGEELLSAVRGGWASTRTDGSVLWFEDPRKHSIRRALTEWYASAEKYFGAGCVPYPGSHLFTRQIFLTVAIDQGTCSDRTRWLDAYARYCAQCKAMYREWRDQGCPDGFSLAVSDGGDVSFWTTSDNEDSTIHRIARVSSVEETGRQLQADMEVLVQCPVSAAACFPSYAVVRTRDRGVIRMGDVVVGDVVFDGRGWTRVIAWLHRDTEMECDFVGLAHYQPCGRQVREVIATANHMLFNSRSEAVPAGDMQVGGSLLGANAVPVTILRRRTVSSRGCYAPLTESGQIVVDGATASCYVGVAGCGGHYAAHVSMAPMRWAARLGLLPVTASCGVHPYAGALASAYRCVAEYLPWVPGLRLE